MAMLYLLSGSNYLSGSFPETITKEIQGKPCIYTRHLCFGISGPTLKIKEEGEKIWVEAGERRYPKRNKLEYYYMVSDDGKMGALYERVSDGKSSAEKSEANNPQSAAAEVDPKK